MKSNELYRKIVELLEQADVFVNDYICEKVQELCDVAAAITDEMKSVED